eukprot:790212-Pleurochrysis_carterae.AAC.1
MGSESRPALKRHGGSHIVGLRPPQRAPRRVPVHAPGMTGRFARCCPCPHRVPTFTHKFARSLHDAPRVRNAATLSTPSPRCCSARLFSSSSPPRDRASGARPRPASSALRASRCHRCAPPSRLKSTLIRAFKVKHGHHAQLHLFCALSEDA